MTRKRPKDEREIYDSFRPFARFLTPAQFEELVRGVILEQRLRKRISQLQEYRKLGITSLAEASEYESARRKKEIFKNPSNAAIAAGSLPTPGALGSSATSALSATAALKRSLGSTSSEAGARKGSETPKAAASSDRDDDVHSSSQSSSSLSRSGRLTARANEADVVPVSMEGLLSESVALHQSQGGKKRKREASNLLQASLSGASGIAIVGGKGNDASSPDFASEFANPSNQASEKLDQKELDLCKHLELTPKQFQQLKATMIHLARVKGMFEKDDIVNGASTSSSSSSMTSATLHVDVAKVGRVYDFIVSTGSLRPAK
jgi:hypothetical protein